MHTAIEHIDVGQCFVFNIGFCRITDVLSSGSSKVLWGIFFPPTQKGMSKFSSSKDWDPLGE